MLKPDMVNQLNAQLNLEFYSSNLYLQMSAWCADKGYEGAAAFLKAHAAEEMEHMHACLITSAIPARCRCSGPLMHRRQNSVQ